MPNWCAHPETSLQSDILALLAGDASAGAETGGDGTSGTSSEVDASVQQGAKGQAGIGRVGGVIESDCGSDGMRGEDAMGRDARLATGIHATDSEAINVLCLCVQRGLPGPLLC